MKKLNEENGEGLHFRKADLHVHTREGIMDNVRHSARELIDKAHQKGFEILAITNHDQVTYDNYLADYAEERGILLIPGVEATISKKHVILLNMDYSPHEIKTFNDLKRLKNGNGLIIAPHPFFPGFTSLHSQLEKHLSIFDGLEYSHFYLEKINFNRRAEVLAQESGLPLIGSSDTHFLWQFSTTYSLIEAEKNIDSVIAAIKEGKVRVVTEPLDTRRMGKIALLFLFLKWGDRPFFTRGRRKIRRKGSVRQPR